LIRYLYIILSLLLAALESRAQLDFVAQTTAGCTPLGVNITVVSPSASSISSYAWAITTPSGATLNASSASYVAIFTEPGNYTVSLTINGSNNLVRPNYITVHERPTANIVADDPVGCFPLCVNFNDGSIAGSAPITSWNWDFGNGVTSTQQNPQNCYATVGSFTPVLSVSDANGCFASTNAPQLINVQNNFPNAQFSSSTLLTCTPPELITFENSSTGNTDLTASWDFGDGNTSTANGNVTHSYSSTGNYTVCLTVTNAIGCEDEQCQEIVLFDEPSVTITQSPNTACAGSSYSFSGSSFPNGAQLTWDFNADGVVDATGQSVQYTFTTPGIFTPALTATYSTSCSSTIEAQPITVTPGVSLVLEADTTFGCSVPFPVQFSANSAALGSTYSWTIDGEVFSGPDVLYVFDTYGNYSVTAQATSPDGCTATLTESNFIQLSPPVVSFNHPPAACVGVGIGLTNINITPQQPDYTLQWDFNSDGTIDDTGIDPAYTYLETGNYFITVHVTNPNGCSVSYTHPTFISVVQSVETTITTSTTLSCAGEAIEFCVNSAPGNQFSWNFHDGTGWYSMDPEELCITHDYQDTGYFNLSLTVFNGVCNTTQEWENYIYITPPVALFDFVLNCDNPLSVEFGDLSIEADQLIWNFGDGSAEIVNDETPTHLFPGPGEYEVTLTAINDALGCPDIAETIITIQDADPGLVFQSSIGCPPVAVAIENTIDNVYWNVQISNGDSLIMQRSVATGVWTANYYAGEQLTTLVTANNQNHWPQLTFSEAGCYDITVEAIDENGCSSTRLYEDVVCVSTDSNFGTFDTNIINACDPFQVEFSTSATDIATWEWSFSDGSNAQGNHVLHTFLPPFYPNTPLTATLTAVNTGGCTSVVTQTISAALPITPSFATSSSAICIQDEISFTNTTSGSATGYSWNFGDGSTALGEDVTHAYTANGVYTVCLTADNGSGCLQTTCINNAVTVATPEASFNFNSTITNCLFGVTFENTSTGIIDELEWVFGDGQSGSADESYHTYSIGVYDVQLIATNQFGCSDTSTVYDIFNYGDIIGPYSVQLDETPCAPFSVDFSAFNPSDNYFTYFWDFNDGSGDPSGATQTQHDYLEPGTYCPSVILTDPDGCQMFIPCAAPIVVEELTTSFSYDNQICVGESSLFSVTGADTYQWSTASFIETGVSENSFILTPPSSASFVLTSTLDDCVRQDTINVVVNPLPEVALSLPDLVCFNSEDILLNTGIPAGASGIYSVNGQPTTVFSSQLTPGQDHEVAYNFTDSLGCSATATEMVYIQELPVLSFDALPGICENADPLLLSNASPAGGTYTFLQDTITSFDPSNLLGAQQIEYSYTDLNGCSNASVFTITVHAAPTAALTMPSVCEDVPFLATSQSTIAGGTIASTQWQQDGQNWIEANPFVPPSAPEVGTHTLRLRLESNFGCITEIDSTFTIWPLPIPSFATENGCQFSALPLVANSSVVSGTIPTYLWTLEGNTFEDDDSLYYEFQTWGTQTIELVNITDRGCDDTLALTMMVYPAPVIDLVVSNACEGTLTQLDSQVSLPLGGIVQHIWDLGDGTTEPSMPAIDHIFEEGGTYTVTYTAQSNLNCFSSSSTELIIHETPAADFAIVDSTVCSGEMLELVDLSAVDPLQEISTWNWYLDNTLISNAQNPVVDFSAIGFYSLRLEVLTNNGCESDTTQLNAVFIMPKPEAGMRIVRDELTMAAPVVDIQNEASDDVVSWLYDLGDNSSANTADVRHTYETWGSYAISQVVTNSFGCSDTTTEAVIVNTDVLVYVPNAFTPDGNVHNEYFKPVFSGFEIATYYLKIFDRWGRVVFETKDPELHWNGNIQNNGAQAMDGAYNWQLDIKTTETSKLIRQAGTVILLR
jgi:gliding motility-associated-like protein